MRMGSLMIVAMASVGSATRPRSVTITNFVRDDMVVSPTEKTAMTREACALLR